MSHPLLALLHAAPHTSEGLAGTSGWALPKVLAALTELEMDGRASAKAGAGLPGRARFYTETQRKSHSRRVIQWSTVGVCNKPHETFAQAR